MTKDIKESPTNAMGTSSSIQGSGPITGYDPLMKPNVNSRFSKRQLRSFRSVAKKANPNRPKPLVKRHKKKLVKKQKNVGH